MGSPQADKTYNIEILGDSIGVYSEYPQALQTALRANSINANVKDRTVSGKETDYAANAAPEIAARSEKPDLVIIALGGNDLLHSVSPDEVRKNLETSIKTLKDSGINVMIAGMQAPPYYPKEYREEFNKIVPELGKKYGITYDPLFIDPVVENPNGMSKSEIFNRSAMNSDLIHPNTFGGRLIAERMEGFVEKALNVSGTPAPASPQPAYSAFAPR